LLDSGLVMLKARWLDFRALRRAWLGSEELQSDQEAPVCDAGDKNVYDSIGVRELLHMEGCVGVAEVWRKYYEEDAFFNHTAANDLPPVRRVLSIHGSNLVTDIGYAVRLHTCRMMPAYELRTRFVLDSEAKLKVSDDMHTIKGGVIFETPSKATGGASGDGVVPMRSMERCLTWAPQVRVDVYRIHGAEHKVLLHKEAYSEYLLKEIDLLGDKTWAVANAVDIGASCAGFEHMRVFGPPVRTDVETTVAALKAGTLAAPEGFCIAYAKKADSYFLLFQADRREAALLALGRSPAVVQATLLEQK